MVLVYLSLACLAGIFLGSFNHLPLRILAIALLPLPLLLLRQHQKKIAVLCVFLLVLLGGIVRYNAGLPPTGKNSIQNYIQGTIIAAPDVRDTYTQLTLKIYGIKSGTEWQKADGKLLVFVSRYPEFSYGDVLQIKGSLETPQRLDEFDYPGYLANQGIFSTMAFPKVALISAGHGFKPLWWIYSLRETLGHKIAEVLPEPQAALAQGILLGIRGNIPQSLKDDFTVTGTTHILAISGVNLNIVTGILVATGVWLFGKRNRLYIWLALVAIWAYSLLTGFDPPVVRAAFMVSLFLFAELLSRQQSIRTALAFSAAIMAVLTPRVLWDVSFQLCFLAMLGLVYVVPPLQSIGKIMITKITGEEGWQASLLKWIIDSFAVTLGVTIVVWPLIARYFGVFSLVSPIATLLILPVLPAIMLFCALAVVAGFIFNPLGIVLGWVAWLFLSYMLTMINGLAKMPAAVLSTEKIHPLIILGYFVLLTGILTTWRYRQKLNSKIIRSFELISVLPKKWVLPPLATLLILVTIFTLSMPDENLHVSYLDVGQGDAILIQIGNQDVLIDGGPSPEALNRELGKRLPFWDRTIELVIVTHPHADHLAGLIDTVNKYHVARILQPATQSASPLWLEWTSLVAKKNITTTEASTRQEISLNKDGIIIEVLRALTSVSSTSLDDEGIVLRLRDGAVSFLFTADITSLTEMDLLLKRTQLASTVLKVAHHGSDTATSVEFLSVVKPSLAVISVGANNDYGHPAKTTLFELTKTVGQEHIYRTDLNGTIELITNGERLWLKKDR